MSTDKLDYDADRLLGTPVAGQEYLHLDLHDFDGSVINNDDGNGGVWIDMHRIYKGETDWDGVWNAHAQAVSDRFFLNSVRISRLYSFLGIEDPEARVSPSGAGAITSTPWIGTTLPDSTFSFVNPDAQGKIDPVQDGMSSVEAAAQNWSVMGTRSFTADPLDGYTWEDFQERDGYYVSHSTTLTHNIDELDQALGTANGYTGFSAYNASSFWNAKDVLAGTWSLAQNDEQLNRAIGSREITDSQWNLGRSNQLTGFIKAGYEDNQQNMTDFVQDINDILGSREIRPTPGTVFGATEQYAISNAGGASDDTTYTSLIGQVNTAIGHRVLENRTGSYVLWNQSGGTMSSWANVINNEIGDRLITNTTGEYPFKDSSGDTLTVWANTTNNTFGDRVIANKAINHILSSDGETMTSYLNSLNDGVGNRNYTQGTGFSLDSLNGSTLTASLDALNVAIGGRQYTQTFLSDNGVVSTTIQQLADYLDSLAIADASDVTISNGQNLIVENSVFGKEGVGKGFRFPDNIGGGTGDKAGLEYWVNSGEDTVLKLYNVNDSGDEIWLDGGYIRLQIGGTDAFSLDENGDGTFNNNMTTEGNSVFQGDVTNESTVTFQNGADFTNGAVTYTNTTSSYDSTSNVTMNGNTFETNSSTINNNGGSINVDGATQNYTDTNITYDSDSEVTMNSTTVNNNNVTTTNTGGSITNSSVSQINNGGSITNQNLTENNENITQNFDSDTTINQNGSTVNQTNVTQVTTGGTQEVTNVNQTVTGGTQNFENVTQVYDANTSVTHEGNVTYNEAPVFNEGATYNQPIIMGPNATIETESGDPIINSSGELEYNKLTTTETNTGLVAKPDGSGGMTFGPAAPTFTLPTSTNDGDILVYNGDNSTSARALPWLVKAWVGRDDPEVAQYQTEYVTFKNILDTFYRFSHTSSGDHGTSTSSGTWDAGTTYSTGTVVDYNDNLYMSNTNNNIGNVPVGDSNDTNWVFASFEERGWELNGLGELSQPLNTSAHVGFTSVKKYTGYTAEVTLKSADDDDDVLTFVVAHTKEAGDDYTISAVRSRATMTERTDIHGAQYRWGLVYNFGKSDEMWIDEDGSNLTLGDWDTYTGGDKIKVIKTANEIRVSIWPPSSSAFTDYGNELVMDLTATSISRIGSGAANGWDKASLNQVEIQRFQNDISWGLGARSQPLCSYGDLFFAGQNEAFIDDETNGLIFNLESGVVWQVDQATGVWTEAPGQSLDDFVENGQAVLDVASGRLYFKQRGILQPIFQPTP